MLCRAVVLWALVWLVPLLSEVAVAQLVEVGPGYVRAPFVRVYTGPGGRTRVQAPFVDVDTPGYRLRRPYLVTPPGRVLPRPPLPFDNSGRPANNAESMSWKQLKEAVREASAQLELELNRFGTTAAGWRKYLHTDQLRQLEAYDDLPPSVAEGQRLSLILKAFENTSQTPAFRAIAALNSFHIAHDALAELLSPPLERQARLLTASARELEQDLMQMAAGNQWRTYLALPASLLATAASPDSTVVLPPGQGPDPAAEIADLDQTLVRFDTISRDPTYRQIAELASFQQTQSHLNTYAAILSTRDALESDRDASLEELPPLVPK